VIVAIERTISLVRSVENDHLNRLMTGDLGERGVYDSSVAALDAQLAALAALTVDNRRHQASIFQLRRLVSVQQADYREQIAILTRQGSEAAIARARVDRDKAVLPTVLATAEDMARVENTLRDQQLEAARRGERLTMVLTVAGWVINLAILTSRLRCT
jgi:CHASE3 domain sensor protein